jgi:hypothetical protein
VSPEVYDKFKKHDFGLVMVLGRDSVLILSPLKLTLFISSQLKINKNE